MESTVLVAAAVGVGETPGCTHPRGPAGGGGPAVLVNAAAVASHPARLSFVDEAAAAVVATAPHRGYDVIPVASSSHGTISVRQQGVEPSVHNKQHIELVHCGKSIHCSKIGKKV